VFIEWLIDLASRAETFFSSSEFLVPFLSTLFASLTVIYLSFTHHRRSEARKRLFAVSYIADISYRIAASTFILRKHTLLPHIEAATKMFEGDHELLENCFLYDDFNVLTDSPMSFQALPEDQKVLIGLDDIDLLQAFEAILYLHSDHGKRRDLNAFVRENLSSSREFSLLSEEEQRDVLRRYRDLLYRADHQANRIVWFIYYIVLPSIHKYIHLRQFVLYSKKTAKKKIGQIVQTIDEYRPLLPDQDYMQRVKMQGIQQALGKNET